MDSMCNYIGLLLVLGMAGLVWFMGSKKAVDWLARKLMKEEDNKEHFRKTLKQIRGEK